MKPGKKVQSSILYGGFQGNRSKLIPSSSLILSSSKPSLFSSQYKKMVERFTKKPPLQINGKRHKHVYYHN